jgi:O-methyltransferase involved in polyketide biosynthesis
MSSTPTAKADGTVLTGVSETALLTLQVRANEARRPDSIIDDPIAIQLADSIDYDFAKFGFSRRQDMAVRAVAYDRNTRRYLVDHPKATVVALAEGLQTSFYRLDAAGVGDQFRWLTVDLPPMIELRRKLLPASERVRMCAQSALDFSWMTRSTPSTACVTTEGLLMYLQPDDAMGLITECAARFPRWQMMFDLRRRVRGVVPPRHAHRCAPDPTYAVHPVGFGPANRQHRAASGPCGSATAGAANCSTWVSDRAAPAAGSVRVLTARIRLALRVGHAVTTTARWFSATACPADEKCKLGSSTAPSRSRSTS